MTGKAEVFAPARGVRVNTLLGVGLWALLWLGYNTGPGHYMWAPDFPQDTPHLINGVRAFLPMLAGWIALVLALLRPNRLLGLAGPLGLMVLYALVGLTTGLLYSPPGLSTEDQGYIIFDQSYWAINHLSITLVLLAMVTVDDPLPDLRNVLRLTWGISTLMTLGLLGAIPFLGASAIKPTEDMMGVRAYGHTPDVVMGMLLTRNTGFARYAAISALATLAGVLRKGSLWVRAISGIFFAVSMYALFLANGRTEFLAFLASVAVLVLGERWNRTVNILACVGGAALLALCGFYGKFFLYLTHTGRVDSTLTGRTVTWAEAWQELMHSPWIGLGFQGDRWYLSSAHLHNAFLHALLQSGFVGGLAMLAAIAYIWVYIIRYFFIRRPQDASLIPPEIPAIWLFATISSITESTFAYFSAMWLLSAPIVAYVLALDQRVRRATREAAWARVARALEVRRRRMIEAASPSTPNS